MLCGAPAIVRSSDFHLQAPSNMDGSELTDNMKALTPHPIHEYTQVSCHIALALSLPFRLEALDLIQKVDANPDYSHVLKLGKSIESFLDNLPACSKVSEDSPGESIGRTFNLTILNIHIREALLTLYLPYSVYSLRIPRPANIFDEAATAHSGSSVYVLSKLDFMRKPPLYAPSPGAEFLKARLCSSYHRLCNTAITRAVLIVSLHSCFAIKEHQQLPHLAYFVNSQPLAVITPYP